MRLNGFGRQRQAKGSGRHHPGRRQNRGGAGGWSINLYDGAYAGLLLMRLNREIGRWRGSAGIRNSDTMMTEDAVLKALDKPRTLFKILQTTDPSGSTDALQILLMKLRDEGKVKFDIKKGNWRKA